MAKRSNAPAVAHFSISRLCDEKIDNTSTYNTVSGDKCGRIQGTMKEPRQDAYWLQVKWNDENDENDFPDRVCLQSRNSYRGLNPHHGLFALFVKYRVQQLSDNQAAFK